jgi:dipeptidyl aminopeptidase/acylaminoacyl peptidase
MHMRFFSHFVFLSLISLIFPVTAGSQAEAPLIPRKALFTEPDKDQVQLSPDGKWIGYRALSGDTMNLWVAPVSEPSKARVVTKQKGAPVLNYRWAYLPGIILYAAPAENGSHFFLLNLANKELRDLTPGRGIVAQFEKLSTDHADEVLLRVKEPDRPTFDYQKINLRTGAKEVVFKNEPNFEQVLFDDDWRPRVVKLRKPDVGYELLKQDGAGAWISFASFRSGIEEDSFQPFALDKAGETLYLTDNRGRDTAALKAIDLETGKETLLVEDPLADVAPAILLHPRTGRAQAVVSNYGRQRRHFLDPSIIPDYEYLRTVHRGDTGILTPTGGRSLDDRIWLVAFMDGGPMRYYIYDRAARRATFLFTENKALDAYSLGRRHLEVITTRDGMNLPADLYLPVRSDSDGNGRPERPLPMLLYVHGGPWATYPWNDWFTNRVIQLLTDRGYAVLRVEFRGAKGFGRRVHMAGVREWGAKMQDDLLDAADWAVKQGITTRNRIGIWGWSYGGYATLAALTTSDRFACGLAMYAPTDLDLLIAQGSPGAQMFWRHHIGDNTTEEGRAMLRERSPLHNVEGITKPVLIVQPGKDNIVRQDHADRFVAAMQKHKKPVTYLLYPDEPHDLRRSESWVSLFAIAERFFHEHLGGRYEPIGDDLSGSLEVNAGRELIPGLSEVTDRRSPAPNRKRG